MPEFQLIIGNKNYSSWSLRPWLLLRKLGVSFEETQVLLQSEDFKHRQCSILRQLKYRFYWMAGWLYLGFSGHRGISGGAISAGLALKIRLRGHLRVPSVQKYTLAS